MEKEFEIVAKSFEALATEIARLRDDNMTLRNRIQGMSQELEKRAHEVLAVPSPHGIPQTKSYY